jgi:hypothetical protein
LRPGLHLLYGPKPAEAHVQLEDWEKSTSGLHEGPLEILKLLAAHPRRNCIAVLRWKLLGGRLVARSRHGSGGGRSLQQFA